MSELWVDDQLIVRSSSVQKKQLRFVTHAHTDHHRKKRKKSPKLHYMSRETAAILGYDNKTVNIISPGTVYFIHGFQIVVFYTNHTIDSIGILELTSNVLYVGDARLDNRLTLLVKSLLKKYKIDTLKQVFIDESMIDINHHLPDREITHRTLKKWCETAGKIIIVLRHYGQLSLILRLSEFFDIRLLDDGVECKVSCGLIKRAFSLFIRKKTKKEEPRMTIRVSPNFGMNCRQPREQEDGTILIISCRWFMFNSPHAPRDRVVVDQDCEKTYRLFSCEHASKEEYDNFSDMLKQYGG